MTAKTETEGYILIVTTIGTEHKAAERLKRIRGVDEVRIIYGSWDLIVRVKVSDFREISNLISKIRSIPEIEYTETLVCT
nr:Lrp/AsnC ligand binding domain-containing protein [Candidatus Baldrarchaeota archaeon]